MAPYIWYISKEIICIGCPSITSLEWRQHKDMRTFVHDVGLNLDTTVRQAIADPTVLVYYITQPLSSSFSKLRPGRLPSIVSRARDDPLTDCLVDWSRATDCRRSGGNPPQSNPSPLKGTRYLRGCPESRYQRGQYRISAVEAVSSDIVVVIDSIAVVTLRSSIHLVQRTDSMSATL